MNTNLQEAKQNMKNAVSEMINAVISLEECGSFEKTIMQLKAQIGDMTIAIQLIDNQILDMERKKEIQHNFILHLEER